MENCNGLPTANKVETPLGIDANVSEDKKYWPKLYASVLGMMFYLSSNPRPDISFSVHKCDRFTHKFKELHVTDLKRIC